MTPTETWEALLVATSVDFAQFLDNRGTSSPELERRIIHTYKSIILKYHKHLDAHTPRRS